MEKSRSTCTYMYNSHIINFHIFIIRCCYQKLGVRRKAERAYWHCMTLSKKDKIKEEKQQKKKQICKEEIIQECQVKPAAKK